jgi:hypothetical protein
LGTIDHLVTEHFATHARTAISVSRQVEADLENPSGESRAPLEGRQAAMNDDEYFLAGIGQILV